MGADQIGPPILYFLPQSLHSWGTTGPNPGRCLKLLFYIQKWGERLSHAHPNYNLIQQQVKILKYKKLNIYTLDTVLPTG